MPCLKRLISAVHEGQQLVSRSGLFSPSNCPLVQNGEEARNSAQQSGLGDEEFLPL
jgi:hypothetical protein